MRGEAVTLILGCIPPQRERPLNSKILIRDNPFDDETVSAEASVVCSHI